jgi:hypothetical protein
LNTEPPEFDIHAATVLGSDAGAFDAGGMVPCRVFNPCYLLNFKVNLVKMNPMDLGQLAELKTQSTSGHVCSVYMQCRTIQLDAFIRTYLHQNLNIVLNVAAFATLSS